MKKNTSIKMVIFLVASLSLYAETPEERISRRSQERVVLLNHAVPKSDISSVPGKIESSYAPVSYVAGGVSVLLVVTGYFYRAGRAIQREIGEAL